MSKNKIFFSYSRDNSDFVLNLAKDLRLAGAHIWLDQLDIKPGSRWDKSIERALANANTLLVILSKRSVESTNVMDEVSFALEENMMVVPILLEPCDIPFRIRRLQYADFTEDYQKGINTLIEALGLEKNVASKLVNVASSKGSNVTTEEAIKAEQVKKEAKETKETAIPSKVDIRPPSSKQSITSNPTEAKNKTPYFIVGGLIVIIVILLNTGVFDVGRDKYEDTSDDGPAIMEAASELPVLVDDDIDTISSIEGQIGATTFVDSVNVIKQNDTILEPISNDSILVQQAIDSIPKRPVPNIYDADWTFAQRTQSVDEYLSYMKKYDSVNPHFAEANKTIDSLFKKEGYVQYKESNGNFFFSKLFWKNADDQLTFKKATGKPSKGDIISATQPRSVRKGVIGIDSHTARNGDVLQVGDKARITDVIKSGNSIWVKILYGN